jgi:hypothetical protein
METGHMVGDPTSYEEAMRSPRSLKWLDAMEDEMKSMSSNDVWDIEEISKGSKTVAVNGSTKLSMTLMGM